MKRHIEYSCKGARAILSVWFLLCASFLFPSYAQETKVRGRVTDAVTGEPVPFTGVYFQGTTIGMSTDLEGCFNISTRDTVSVLCASILGAVREENPPGIIHGGGIQARTCHILIGCRRGEAGRQLYEMDTQADRQEPEPE